MRDALVKALCIIILLEIHDYGNIKRFKTIYMLFFISFKNCVIIAFTEYIFHFQGKITIWLLFFFTVRMKPILWVLIPLLVEIVIAAPQKVMENREHDRYENKLDRN